MTPKLQRRGLISALVFFIKNFLNKMAEKLYIHTTTECIPCGTCKKLGIGDVVDFNLDNVTTPLFPESIRGLVQDVVDFTYTISYESDDLNGGATELNSSHIIDVACTPDLTLLKEYVDFIYDELLAVNVKHFGAVGDNVTDDTTAIQAAIDYAAVEGAAVYFPVGIYRVDRTSQVGIDDDKQSLNLHSNITLVGESRKGSVIKPTDTAPSNMPVLYAASGNSTGITIQNITIDGNKDRPSVGGGSDSEDEGINFKEGDHCSVINVDVRNCGQDGVDADGGSYFSVTGCHLHDNGGNGIHMAGGGMNRATVSDCVIRNNGHVRFLSATPDVAASAAGIDSKGGSDITISNCVFVDNARGYLVYGAIRVAVSNCSIIGGNNVGGSALSLRGSVGVGSGIIHVSNCFISSDSSSGNHAVLIEDGFAQANFDSCQFISYTGVTVLDGGILNVSDCYFDCASHGVHVLENRGKAMSISGNTFSDGLFGNSLRVESDAYGTFSNNSLYKTGTSQTGVDIYSSSGVWFIKDNFFPTNMRAVRLDSGSEGHVITGNKVSGFIELKSSNNTIKNNILNDITLNFSSTAGNMFTGNAIGGVISLNSSIASNQFWSGNYGAGAYAEHGSIDLAAGVATVPTAIVNASSRIMLTRSDKKGSTAIGSISLNGIVPSTSFSIASLSSAASVVAGDVSEVHWHIYHN